MQTVAAEQVPAVRGHGVVAGGFGHVEVRAVEDDTGLVVAGAGQGVEQRGPGGFVQTHGLRGDLRRHREVRDRNRGDDLFDRMAADAVAQEQLVLAEHFEVEGFVAGQVLTSFCSSPKRNSRHDAGFATSWGVSSRNVRNVSRSVAVSRTQPCRSRSTWSMPSTGKVVRLGMTLVKPLMAVLSSADGQFDGEVMHGM